MPTSLLSRLRHESAPYLLDTASGQHVLHVSSPHVLIQAAGYLKYIQAQKSKKGVFLRGQTCLYKKIGPTLFRGAKEGPQIVKRRKLLDNFLADLKANKRTLRAVDEQFREALLQHYGIRTTWLDVVDNIWVALWFACHHAKVYRKGNEEYLHFEKRILRPQVSRPAEYAYILLLESAYFDPVAGRPGHYRDDRSETIDLRIAVPSHFVRPHAQHGLLVRRLSKVGLPVGDCSPLHIGTIRVDLHDALDWLGNALTLTSHSLFPPAFYDYGYRELLQSINPKKELLGAIHRVQA